MAKHGGRPEDYCPVTGKRKFTSDKAAKQGLRRLTGDRLGTYRCPHCHSIHFRNQDRYAKRHGSKDSRSAPRRPPVKKKRKKKKPKKSQECGFCLGPRGFGTFSGRKICKECTMRVRTPEGRFWLESAALEVDRIRAAEREGS